MLMTSPEIIRQFYRRQGPAELFDTFPTYPPDSLNCALVIDMDGIKAKLSSSIEIRSSFCASARFDSRTGEIAMPGHQRRCGP